MQNHFSTLPREREIESTMNVHGSREKHSRKIEGESTPFALLWELHPSCGGQKLK